MDHFGVRGTFGWENYDQSEWQLSGWVLLENEVVLGGFGQTPAAGDIDLQVFRLPLFDGTPSGTNIPYDDFLEIRFDQLFYGVDFDYWNTPSSNPRISCSAWRWGSSTSSSASGSR